MATTNNQNNEHEATQADIKKIDAAADNSATTVRPEDQKLIDGTDAVKADGKKKTKKAGNSFVNFLYDPRRKTVLGRDGLNWAQLSAFYAVFYFIQGCFFVSLLYVFALMLDRHVPTYYNTESTMAVRSTSAVVGLGFRPQPLVEDNLIRVSNDPREQRRIASSLRLFRDVFLIQKADARTDNCTESSPASELAQGVACTFNWFHIVTSQSHPCSDNNMYGFENEEPCVLVKLNKVFDWTPSKGALPVHIQQLRGISNNRSIAAPDVYITCNGTNVADDDALKGKLTYYSLEKPLGSSKYGAIPNYYFPYRNAKDHVQPFVLVQFKNLPFDQLISVTCRAWAPGITHETRGTRGMVIFQLYRSHQATGTNVNVATDQI